MGSGVQCVRWCRCIVLLSSTVVCIAMVISGCGQETKPDAPPVSPALDQAAIDAAVAPLPEESREDLARSLPEWVGWADRLRAVYAALPPEAKHEMASTGEYAFRLADLPKEQADVIKELIEQDPDENIRHMLEQWAGKPLDFSKLAFAYKRQGNDVGFAFRVGGSEYAPAPIGLWPGEGQAK